MAIVTAVCNSYKQEVLQGIHSSEDNYKIALFTDAATLDASTTAYSSTNEVANGNGYATGGINLSGFSAGLSSSTAYVTFSDAQWTTATITARGCLIYNSSKDNRAVAVCDFGANVSSTNGTFTLDFPAAGAAAFIRLD